MSAAPNIIPIESVTLIEWIKAALSKPIIPSTDKVYLNGYSENPIVKEAIESLAIAHKAGGTKAAKTAWDEQIAPRIPDIAQIINRRQRVYHCSELAALPPVRWLIDNEIPQLAFVVLFGPPEVGKSFLAIDYAERVAGHKPVAYVMGEGRSGYAHRHAAWLHHHKRQHGHLFFIDDAVQLMNPTELQLFIDDLKEIKPKFVVIDTLARCFDGDENSAKDMGQFVRACDRIRQEFQCTVMVVHHSGKSTGGERGSSALRGAADTMIEIGEDDNRIKVSCAKMKDGQHFTPYFLKRVDVILEPGISSCVLLPANIVADKVNEITNNQRLVLETLFENPMYDKGAKFNQLKQSTNIADSSLSSALKALLKKKFLYKTGTYEPYALTADGISFCRIQRIGK